MKRILIILSLVVFGLSCEKNLTDLNVDRKRPAQVPAPTLFANAEKNLADVVSSGNVNLNISRLLAQYWTQTTYTDESRYDLATRNIPNNFWNAFYRDVLRDLQEAKNVLNAQTGSDLDTAQRTNQLAMVEILEVYAWSVLVNTFGNIPYTEALDVQNVLPKYDSARAIYNDLLARLDTAVNALDPDEGSFAGSDLIYGGDVEQWTKFGNSLRLRLGMMLADVDPAKAKAVVEDAAKNVFSSNGDNAVFQYLEAPPNTNPVWVDLVQSGRKDFIAANTITTIMNQLSDPRRPLYFTLSSTDDYKGGVYGSSNSYATYSKPSKKLTAPDFPGVLMDYAEVEFLLAEAVERGFDVEGTAESHYNKAVTASILYWGGTEAEAQAYLAQPEVAYGSAAGEWRQKIGTQKWLALYNQGLQGWTEWRRLDFPRLNTPNGLEYADIPLRFNYPVNEQNLNKANYEAAASAIGGDVVTTKLFWDVR